MNKAGHPPARLLVSPRSYTLLPQLCRERNPLWLVLKEQLNCSTQHHQQASACYRDKTCPAPVNLPGQQFWTPWRIDSEVGCCFGVNPTCSEVRNICLVCFFIVLSILDGAIQSLVISEYRPTTKAKGLWRQKDVKFQIWLTSLRPIVQTGN